ncbi:type I polyketide synthase [Streptomyces chartreusis]
MTHELRWARRRVEALEADVKEPIAIVGIGCRYPGDANSADDLWRLVTEERDVISSFPADRGWDLNGLVDPDPDRPGKTYAAAGGFLSSAADFDADFFSISPREALAMDPQQRILLETSWEALEHALIDPRTLRGSQTGVYIGALAQDYGPDMHRPDHGVDGFLLTGTTPSVASGRIAFLLGLVGPVLTVDTACSSSLVAVHLAVQALRHRECAFALAGGATVMSTPGFFVEFSRQRGLAPDGKCKAFGAGADGTVFGEGAGILALERLSDAQRNNRRILAVIRGTAINHDGRSSRLTAPNGQSQQQVIEQALSSAGLRPDDVDAVEGHGTGTMLGDPVEAQALLSIYGCTREHPLWLGSLKSNIGHAQAAAGVGGIIKMVQAMRHGTLPRTLYADSPTPHVDWSQGQVEVLTQARPWPDRGRSRRAAVSSFGISGTNAHAILEQAPAPVACKAAGSALVRGPVVWALSARSAEALRGQAAKLRHHIAQMDTVNAIDIGYSLAATRTAFEERAVILGTGRDDFLAGLDAMCAGRPAGNLVMAQAADQPMTAFVFSGQGTQRPGMGQELAAVSPAFAHALDEVCAALDKHLDRPLREVMWAPRGSAEARELDQTRYAQPALFALEVALFQLMTSWGISPGILAGHSIGEIAAAYVSGLWTLEDAATVVSARGRLMQGCPPGGAMIAIGAEETAVRQLLADRETQVSIAAVNGPRAVVVSGQEAACLDVAAAAKTAGALVKRLRVSHAFHSPLMDPILAEFSKVLEDIRFHTPTIPIISNLTGLVADSAICTPGYWVDHMRQTVRFNDGLQAIKSSGCTLAIELGPDETLTTMAEDSGVPLALASMFHRNETEPAAAMKALAGAFAHGGSPNWRKVFGPQAQQCDLPTYAFQHSRYWLDDKAASADVESAGLDRVIHPLLSCAVEAGRGSEVIYSGLISLARNQWLAQHAVSGSVVLPAAAWAELACAVGRRAGLPRLAELVLERPLILDACGAVQLQVVVEEKNDSGMRPVQLYARPQAGPARPAWTRYASGWLAPRLPHAPEDAWTASWPPSGATRIDLDELYARLAARGYDYGPAFRGLQSAWRRGNEIYAELDLPAGERDGFDIHPALLDAALHPCPDLVGDSAAPVIPFSLTGTDLLSAAHGPARAKLTRTGPDAVRLQIAAPNGAPVASVESIRLRPWLAPHQAAASFVPQWVRLPREDAKHGDGLPPVHEWVVVGSGAGLAVTALAGSSLKGIVRQHPDLDALVASGEIPELVVAMPRPCSNVDAPDEAAAVCADMLALMQRCPSASHIVVLTRGAMAVAPGEAVADLAGCAVWGMVRSAQAEDPGRFTLVDADAVSMPALATAVSDAIRRDEDQIAIRQGEVWGLRLTRADTDQAEELLDAPDAPWRIVRSDQPAKLALTAFTEVDLPLAPGQVRIAVRAGGLNFRDALITVGLLPTALHHPIGLEGAGIVVETAADVTDLRAGDRVMGLLPAGIGPVVVTDRRMVTTVPRNWSFAQAAGAPVAFLTAYYGLKELAGVKPGERLLVHAATGGVGMAACQLARLWGVQVRATASEPKWPVLRGGGLAETDIASSRSLEFKDRFRAGVDVVLNCLAGKFVDASLSLLPPGGRFLEVGKSDIRDPDQVAGKHPGISYHPFDLQEVSPDLIHSMLEDLRALFDGGVLDPLPVSAWDIRRAPAAIRHLSSAHHVGKVILILPQKMAPDGTVLITGAGALAGHLARHLVNKHGMRHLLLVSRQGAADERAAALRDELAASGADIFIEPCDVGDYNALKTLFDGIPADRPLTAVIHTAGLLDDAVFRSQTPDRLAKVFRPKVSGAWNLDRLTRERESVSFTVFSSAAGILGTAGQANYAAANAFLDGLAQQRYQQGLPALSLAWGMWAGDDGMAGRLDSSDQQRMRRATGLIPLSVAEGVTLFDLGVRFGQPILMPAKIDLAAVATPQQRLPAILRSLAQIRLSGRARQPAVKDTSSTSAAEPAALAERLAVLEPDQRKHALTETIRMHVAQVLGHQQPATIPVDRPFAELGLSSLTAVELRNQLNATTGLRLASTAVYDHPTCAGLAQHLVDQLLPRQEGPGASANSIVSTLASELTRLVEGTVETIDRADLSRQLHDLADSLSPPTTGRALEAASDEELIRRLDRITWQGDSHGR